MKPMFKQKTFILAVLGIVTIIGMVIANKVFALGMQAQDFASILVPLITILTGYIGTEKMKDSKVIATQIETKAILAKDVSLNVLKILGNKNEKIAKVATMIEEGIEDYTAIQKEIEKEL